MRWAGFGSVLAEEVDQNYIYMLSSIKLLRTAPLVLGILESDITIHRLDNSRLKSYIPLMFIVTFAWLPWEAAKCPSVIMTLVAESNIAELELMIRPLTMIFLHGPTPSLTKSLAHFQIQSFVLLKFEEPTFEVPKALQLARAEKPTSVK